MKTSNKIQTIAAKLAGNIAVDVLKSNISVEEAARFQYNQLIKIGCPSNVASELIKLALS